ASWAWVERGKILSECDFEGYKNILRFLPFLKILIVTAAFFIIKRLIVSRKKIFISEFKDHTGIKNFEKAVSGIPARLLNEMHRLSKLLKNIDEAQPDPKNGMIPAEMDVWDMGKNFDEIIGPEAIVEIKGVKFSPILIFNFFKKLVHGPVISGSVTRKDNENLVLTACLRGGRFKGSWEITVDTLNEYYDPPASENTTQLIQMTDILVCCIFTDLSRGASPRWQAMKRYTDGLRQYRKTLRTQEKRIENLFNAKDSFVKAVRSDDRFYHCYYNFGIIYEKLNSRDAAIAAFRKALKAAPENHHCYYRLAYLYYGEKNYYEAERYSRKALAICPTDPKYWALLAFIKYYEWSRNQMDDYKNDLKIPRYIVQYFSVAEALGWKAHCKDALCGGAK
ncbi:MAG: tetratricopeptide repeat protein, partial [Candidatus Aminicenantes bacterium]|nr:tetratricopeptide repeat protein [Candidatus Aminicenantes bacterium]